MCYHVCGMANIKDHLLLIEKSIPCRGGRDFPSISELFFYHLFDAI